MEMQNAYLGEKIHSGACEFQKNEEQKDKTRFDIKERTIF